MIANTANNLRPLTERPVLETPFYESYKHLIQNDRYQEWAGYTTLESFACEEAQTVSIYSIAVSLRYLTIHR